jgi:choline dehydrogenase-like flavoprotein
MTLLAEPATGGIVDGTRLTGERRVRADVVVVGSGAGGAPVAKALAEAGRRVVVVEEGAYFARQQLNARPRDMTALLYRDAGQVATVGTPAIMLPTGRAVGGTTLVNSGTCFRTPDRVLRRWQGELGVTIENLDALYAQVEREIGVHRVTPELAGANARIAKRGADALGWSGHYLDRNAVGCQGSGVCAFGCPTGAKQHAGEVYMNAAHAAGAITYTNARALRIDMEDNATRARGITARTRGGGTLVVTADETVVAAGTLHTPLLLAASGITTNKHLGRHLSIHPATAAWAIMDEVVDMARGVPQSYGVDEFAGEGIMLEGIAGPPDYLAMAVPYSGVRHRELMLDYRHVAQFGLMIEDTSRGHIPVGRIARAASPGRPIIRYDINERDVKTIANGVARLAELLFAAGARRVILPLARMPELASAAELPRLRAHDVRAQDLKLMAFHPLGTARMAASATQGVTAPDHRVHGTTNLYISDGSAVPTALGVNPQLTIMAFATRLASRLLA